MNFVYSLTMFVTSILLEVEFWWVWIILLIIHKFLSILSFILYRNWETIDELYFTVKEVEDENENDTNTTE